MVIRSASFALCATISVLAAQGVPPSVPEGLLPTGAMVVETADLRPATGKNRTLVLWMQNPTKEVRKPNDFYCGDEVYGDHWFGPTRLSLVDVTARKSVNTISIESGYPADSFQLPFRVHDAYYHVPLLDSDKEGKPRLLHLRDFTGDGVAAEFVLFGFAACGIAETSVFGYQTISDQVVQYPVEVTEGKGKPEVKFWIQQIFRIEPPKPGHWNFSWNPGRGADFKFHERVYFDKVRQRFVQHRTMIPLKLKM